MQIRCAGDNGVVKIVPSDHRLITLLLDKEFNIGVGQGTQRAIMARHSLMDFGKLRLSKIKVTLEKIPNEN